MAILIDEPSESDAPACFDLVKRVFGACVGRDYSAQGIASYYELITPEYVRDWKRQGRICLVAKQRSVIAGIIDVRDTFHLTMFFVDMAHQKQGIGSRLLHEAIAVCREKNPGLATMEVHSSPFAVKIYEKLGFVAQSGEQVINGIRFTPMELDLRSGGLL